MKVRSTKTRALTQSLLAVVLACGLMMPNVGLLAYGEEQTAAVEQEQLATDETVSAEGREVAVSDEQSLDADNADQVLQHEVVAVQPETDDEQAAESGVTALTPITNLTLTTATALAVQSEVEGVVPQTDAAGYTDYNGLSIAGGTAGVDYALENVVSTSVGRVETENYDAYWDNGRNLPCSGSFSVTIPSIVIKKNGTYRIKNTSGVATAVGTSVRVEAGVKADITFEGVNITSYMPFNIVTNSHRSGNLTTEITGDDVADKTTVHITLADGTTNTLQSNYFSSVSSGGSHISYQFPALRCGEGSVLTIDDAVRNVDINGNPITPKDGLIPGGVTYINRDGVQATSTGDGKDLETSLSNLESHNAGILNAFGGIRSAAIGGGPVENSGEMTFNGGVITTRANGPAGNNSWGENGAGCGIGGGHAGGSTVTVFNGGIVDAYASYHGAAIGGGCTYVGGMSRGNQPSYPLPDAIVSRNVNHTIAGDITINGGFIEAHGAWHSNAFGQGCGGNNGGKTILITGGTLLPHWGGNGDFLEIGGLYGYVVITGGSVYCTRFQGNDNDGKAYGDLDHKTKVGMLTINVSPKIEAMANSHGVEPDYNANLETWTLLVDRFKPDPLYGAPSRLNDGHLYLWLREGINDSSQIDASFSYYVGSKLVTSNTNLPQGSSKPGQDTFVKEWENFKLKDEFIEENWTKYYDGESLKKVDLVTNPILVDNPAGGKLDKNDTVEYFYQQVSEFGDAVASGVTSADTPADAGLYDIEVRSTQYRDDSVFAQTYWGHNATGQATIKPVTSKTTWDVIDPVRIKTTDADGNEVIKEYTSPTWMQDENAGNFNTATNNHLIVPVDIASDVFPFGDTVNGKTMSSTKCAAPTGHLQLYIDGRAVPERLGGVIELTKDNLADAKYTQAWTATDNNGRTHSIAYFNLTRGQLEAFGLEDKSDEGNQHKVYVEYLSIHNKAISRDEIEEDTAALADDPTSEDSPAVEEDAEATQAGVAGLAPAYTDSSYVNYYESTTSVSPIEIELATPDFKLYNEVNTGYIPNGEGLDDADKAANDAKLKLNDTTERDWTDADGNAQGKEEFTDVGSFRDVVDEETGAVTESRQDWFPLYVQTNSIGNIVFESSNPAVIQIEPNSYMTDREYIEGKTDYGVGAVARVLSAGKTTITATIKGTGAYASVTKSFDIYVFPDLAKKPELTITETAYVSSRTDGTVRPGDTIRYTATATNTTRDSACINPVYEIAIPGDTTFKGVTVVDPAGNEIENPSYHIEDGKVIFDGLPTLFGNESYKFKLDVTVNSDLFDPDHGAADFTSNSKVSGIYGVNPDKFSWDDRIPAEGLSVEAVSDDVDPTWPDTHPQEPKPIVPDPDTAKDILGGDLIEETPKPSDPDDPSSPTLPKEPGVPVGPVAPDTPFGDAKVPHPDDPSRPSDPTDPDDPSTTPKNPIQEGDRIISFGDKDDPETPDDIAKELDEQIKKKLEEDPEADHVDIPVTILRPDPTGGEPTIEEVIVTVPITDDMRPETPDPDDRDDHDVLVVPADPDPRPSGEDEEGNPIGGDIKLDKSAQNVTAGFENRVNKNIALVGDTIRFTISATNTHQGSSWYDVLIKDPLPEGVAYVPGSAQITDAYGKTYTNFDVDFSAEDATIGFCIGDLPGVSTATITFDCVVTPVAATGIDVPSNKAYAYGTLPSTVVKPDPDNPDGPVVIDREPTPVGPYNPEDHDKTWEDIDKEKQDEIKDIFGGDPEEVIDPIETPSTPIDEVYPGVPDKDKLITTKTAVNKTERKDGSVYVGDVIHYVVTLANTDGAHTMWYDVILEDRLPSGLNPVAGSMKLTLADGKTIDCPDEAYSQANGNIAVYAGNVRGGEQVSLEFDAIVTPDALTGDIANVGYAYGSPAYDIPLPVLKGDESSGMPELGHRFDPGDGWDAFYQRNGDTLSKSGAAFPEGFSGEIRDNPAYEEGFGVGKGDSVSGANAGGDDLQPLPKGLKLAQTGDSLGLIVGGALMVVALALVMLVFARRRSKYSARKH
ncbi:DUF11 domain-containing protein [Adlercreutzia agrestimuris]|uniref:DUF11 domain-containing protein n=1 Tax=Adlercreutzia agrestimuris TaxID=2941324 RepID=UPI00203C52AA|nr:DUF11 domain-containing protein [Adlercreutzia agrestimuris]